MSAFPRSLRPQVVTGAEAVRATSKLMHEEARRDQWPYEWLYPPPGAELVHQVGNIPAPAAATQTLVNSYTVPNNLRFVLAGLVQICLSTAFVPGSGSARWVLDVNIAVGAVAPPGYRLQGFANELVSSTVTAGMTIPYGLYQGGFIPYWFPRPFILNPTDVLRSKVTTTADIPPGSPNFFITVFDGWLLPL